jgi:hypothetical protein
MNDMVTVFTEMTVDVLFSLTFTLLTVGGLWLTKKAGDLLGAKNMTILQESLEPSIQRAIALARTRGLTGATLKAEVIAYIVKTRGDTLGKLNASTGALATRVDAELAKREVPGV